MNDLISAPLHAISFSDVIAFCSHQTRENSCLEYKREFSSSNRTKQVAKEVAAFANTHGGIIIFGVDETSDRQPVAKPGGENLGLNPRAAVISACSHRIVPPVVPEISEYLENPNDPSRGFLVVRIVASESVHTTDDGRGIYVRVNDQSEPVRASIDQISWMLAKREKASATQQTHRETGLSRLCKAIHSTDEPGILEVAFGPTQVYAPLLELHDLRKSAVACSVESYAFNDTVPISSVSPVSPVTSVASGAYSIDCQDITNANSAGMVDVFANITVVSKLMRRIELENPRFTNLRVKRDQLPTQNGEYIGFDCASILERIIAVLHAGKRLFVDRSFVGNVELLLRTKNVRGYPLVIAGFRGDQILATCPVDSSIEVRHSFLSSRLDKITEILKNVSYELLWAWGRIPEQEVEIARIIDKAEQLHFGRTLCKCNNSKPVNRELCVNCRHPN